MISLAGKTALVTGGGAGIGLAIAQAFTELGAELIVAENHPKALAALPEALPKALISATDVRERGQVEAMIDVVKQRFGRLDILVNNVGDFLRQHTMFADSEPELWDRLYDINLRHMFLVTRAAMPLLRATAANSADGASIINVSTIEAFRGIPGNAIYSAFKAGVTGFTRSLAVELAPSNIRVNAIAPETTETKQVQPYKLLKPELYEHVKRWIPLGRFGLPSDAAGCAVFLATPLSAWITGTTINLDGGALAAAGWYRTPDGSWTNVPVVTAAGI